MNQRVRTLWLPALSGCLFGFSLLTGMVRAGLQPRLVWLAPAMAVAFYVPWFVGLIVVGALVAWWSRRAGGNVGQRIEAVLLPPAATAVFLTLVWIFDVIFARHHTMQWMVGAWLVVLTAWVFLPGAGLLVGALPFLGMSPAQKPGAATQS